MSFDIDNFVLATEDSWKAGLSIPMVGNVPNGDFSIPVDSFLFEYASGNSLSNTGGWNVMNGGSKADNLETCAIYALVLNRAKRYYQKRVVF